MLYNRKLWPSSESSTKAERDNSLGTKATCAKTAL